jgi:hypothetical protein
MAEARDRYRAKIYLICLMPSQLHPLLETHQGNLSAFVGQVITAWGLLRHSGLN